MSHTSVVKTFIITVDELASWLFKNVDTELIDNILSQATEIKDPQDIFQEIAFECEQISKSPIPSPQLSTNNSKNAVNFETVFSNVNVNEVLKEKEGKKGRRRGAPREVRKIKKRIQNRNAALRYRSKKKNGREERQTEMEQLEKQNVALKVKIDSLQEEIDFFKSRLNHLHLTKKF